MRALAVPLIGWLAALLRMAGRRLLGALRLGSLRRGLARPVAIAIAIVMPMMVPVVVPVRPLPMLSMPGRRLFLLLLCRRLTLFRCWPSRRWPSIRRSPAVMMRPVPALAAWTAVMSPFALAFSALKLGLWSAETPDLFEFRLSVLGRRTICRLWRCRVWRQQCGLC